jgi:helix-turn-helix protein
VTERLLTAGELGEILGYKPATIVDRSAAGKLPTLKVRGRLRFRLCEVEAWLEEHRRGPVPSNPPVKVLKRRGGCVPAHARKRGQNRKELLLVVGLEVVATLARAGCFGPGLAARIESPARCGST